MVDLVLRAPAWLRAGVATWFASGGIFWSLDRYGSTPLALAIGAVYVVGGIFFELYRRAPDANADGVPDGLEARHPGIAAILRIAAREGWVEDAERALNSLAVRKMDASTPSRGASIIGALAALVGGGLVAGCGASLTLAPKVCVDDQCTAVEIVVDRRGDVVRTEVVRSELDNASASVAVRSEHANGVAWVWVENGEITSGYCLDVLSWSECHGGR